MNSCGKVFACWKGWNDGELNYARGAFSVFLFFVPEHRHPGFPDADTQQKPPPFIFAISFYY
jgi:hypothetical protein